MATIEVIQRTLAKRGPGTIGLSQDDLGALHVTQAGLKYAELARADRVFAGSTQGGTAIAPKASRPTTTAGWGIYNPIGSGRNLFVVQAGVWSVSGTLGLGMSLIGAVAQAPTTTPTSYTSSAVSSLTGAGYNSKTIFFQAGTLLTTPAWFTIASRDQVSAISVGSGLVGVLDGFVKVIPGWVFTVDVLAPVGTAALFGADIVWAETDC